MPAADASPWSSASSNLSSRSWWGSTTIESVTTLLASTVTDFRNRASGDGTGDAGNEYTPDSGVGFRFEAEPGLVVSSPDEA